MTSVIAKKTRGEAAVATVPLFVYGATGMLGGELLRLLELHPAFAPTAVSRKAGSLAESQPHVQGATAFTNVEAAETELAAALERGPAAVALSLPHGESGEFVKRLRASLGAKFDELVLVDLAADFRLADPELYRATYKHAHPCVDELSGFAYGLPEFHRARIASSRRTAAAGCFATALQLAVVPAARAGLLDVNVPWILHGVTGSSGSGAEPKPGTHHPYRHGNLWAYSLDGHRHEAELAQALGGASTKPAKLHFVAHSGPFTRGIHLTCALPLARPLATAEARAVYAQCFAGEPFVEVLEAGVPDLRRIAGSNRAALGLNVRGDVLTVLCTLDNLVKGGAGQALQCLNLMFGFPETWGLPRSGLGVA
ncbi:MAG: N-acetyl-gamma-glutamyl-phosphate reductase [Planctomycetes bacterium]|nr:N-acetyl-gamma-glutamyl-phosphate reductase [Planctomycetota bacterium]